MSDPIKRFKGQTVTDIVVSLKSFQASTPEQLSFQAGQHFCVVDYVLKSPHWFLVKDLSGIFGLVPKNHFKAVTNVGCTGENNTKFNDSENASDVPKSKVIVKFAYHPKSEDELELQVGEFINVVEKKTDGWWKGETRNGLTGLFPSNLVEELENLNTDGYENINKNRNSSKPSFVTQQTVPIRNRTSKTVVAEYTFDAASLEELSIEKGEIVDIIDSLKHDPDWILAKNSWGVIGLVPKMFLKNENHTSGDTSCSVLKSQDFGDLLKIVSIDQEELVLDDVSKEKAEKLLPNAEKEGKKSRPIDGEKAKIKIKNSIESNYVSVNHDHCYNKDQYLTNSTHLAYMEHEPWFFGRISRQQADEMLWIAQKGEFLVRHNESDPGSLSISVRGIRRTKHFLVETTDGQLKLGSRIFSNMTTLIGHFTVFNILSSATEKLCLTRPIPK